MAVFNLLMFHFNLSRYIFDFAEDWLQSEEATERRTKRTEENKNKEEKTCNNSNDKSIDEHKMVPVYVLKFVYYSFCI